MEVHVQVERAAKALDDGHRTGAAASVARCLGSLSVEALQCTRVDREHRAAEMRDPRQADSEARREGSEPTAEPGRAGARGR